MEHLLTLTLYDEERFLGSMVILKLGSLVFYNPEHVKSAAIIIIIIFVVIIN